MHDEHTRKKAIEMRLGGMPIKTISRDLGVSIGWASQFLGCINVEETKREPLKATPEELEEDLHEWKALRAKAYAKDRSAINGGRTKSVDELMESTKNLSYLPEWRGKDGHRLDRLQQEFANYPWYYIFHHTQEKHPILHSHLVAWRARRHGQAKASQRFGMSAKGLRDFVIERRRAPSAGSRDRNEYNLAAWISKWSSKVRAKGDAVELTEREVAFRKVDEVVCRLRSNFEAIRRPAMDAVESGEWEKMFIPLLEKNEEEE